ncbi:MAG TPA: hypothetical protein VFD70_01830, partial [Anaerolineae bacterium]|nr:hypothetical protein [Anaerolineae bacterium]
MTLDEKILYHQIHPVKLAADWGATPLALYWFWRHKPFKALLAAFVPAILASAAVIEFANLEPYKNSSLGLYMKQNMTQEAQSVRLIGFVIMAMGAWLHRLSLIPAGLAVVLFGWT